jgi:hypothetical protein
LLTCPIIPGIADMPHNTWPCFIFAEFVLYLYFFDTFSVLYGLVEHFMI